MSQPRHIKGQFVKNPKTGRFITVGLSCYNKLRKEGYFPEGCVDPRELGDIKSDDKQELENQKFFINRRLPPNKHAVKGRGVYKGKLVVRDRGVDVNEMSKFTAKVARKAMRKNLKKLIACNDTEEIDRMLEELIREGMSKPFEEGKKEIFKVKKAPPSECEEEEEEEDEEEESVEEEASSEEYEDSNEEL